MNKRLWFTTLLVFATVWLTDWVIHGMILNGFYANGLPVWRPMGEAQMLWLFLGQLFIAVFFTRIFVKGYEGKGWKEGVRFGLTYIGPFSMATHFINYAVMAIPMTLMWWWVAFTLLQSATVGWVAAWVWQKSATWWTGSSAAYAGK